MVSLITIFGTLGLTGGALGYFFFPMGLEMGLKMVVNLAQNGMVYSLYMNPPITSRAAYYLYEVKNPRDVLVGKKMDLKLKGPYIFDARLIRDNISFSRAGEVVSYSSMRKFFADEGNSANFDEKFWMINPVLPTVSGVVKRIVLDKIPFQRVAEPIVYQTVNILIDQYKERLFVKRTPRDILEGKKVELLEFVTNIADSFGLKSLVPPGPPNNIFGLIYFQNETIDTLEVYAGVGNSKDKYAEVLKWNYRDKVKFWKGKCGTISGTNGELYKPMPKVGKPIRVFLPQLCRSFDMDPVGDVIEIQDGLMALEYEISPRLYLGARKNPNNKCFCLDLRSYDCQFDGLINMSPCFFDAPVWLAKANLEDADERIRATINKDSFDNGFAHKQSFYLDPITGTVLKLNLTLNTVIKMVRQPYLRDMAKIRNLTYAPFFLANESFELPYNLTWQMKLLQVMTNYYKPMYAALSAGGTSMLAMKFLYNRIFT